jgi:hypothetical protein
MKQQALEDQFAMSPSDDSEREDLEAMRLLDETLLVARAAKKKSRIRRTRKINNDKNEQR